MEITTIIENVSNKNDLPAKYGLSLVVKTNGHTFLVDAGYDEQTLLNFHALGFNLNDMEGMVISHNHNDHIGGLESFLKADDNLKFYISSDCKTPLFTKKPFRRRKLVSCVDVIEKYEYRAVFVKDVYPLFENVYLCQVKNPNPDYFCKDKKLRMIKDGKLIKDDFKHEIYVAVIENDKLKIISSCSHNGIINIIDDAEKKFNKKATAFVGGLHYKGKSKTKLNCKLDFLKDSIDKLNETNLKSLYTCHCTGKMAFEIIKDLGKAKTRYFSTGDIFTI